MFNYTRDEAAALSSSLSAANPDATSWPVDVLQISSTSSSSTPTPSSLSSSGSSSLVDDSTTTSTADLLPTMIGLPETPAASRDTESSDALPAGAIAGIVLGVVGGLALLGAGAFFLWRRKKAPQNGQQELDANGNPYAIHPAHTGSPYVHEKYAHVAAYEAPGAPAPPVEMPGTVPSELPGYMPDGSATDRK